MARCSSGGTAPETATSITPTFSPPRRSHRVRPSSAAAAERDEHELAGRRRRRRGARRGACLEAAEGAMCPRRARPRRRGCGLGGESESDERKTDEEKTAAGPACDPGTLVGRACDRSWAEPPTDLWSSCRPVVGRATARLVSEWPSRRPVVGRAADRISSSRRPVMGVGRATDELHAQTQGLNLDAVVWLFQEVPLSLCNRPAAQKISFERCAVLEDERVRGR